jgi:hypothetical protein
MRHAYSLRDYFMSRRSSHWFLHFLLWNFILQAGVISKKTLSTWLKLGSTTTSHASFRTGLSLVVFLEPQLALTIDQFSSKVSYAVEFIYCQADMY